MLQSTTFMKTFEVVIGDVHARPHAVEALLLALGAVDRQGRRRDGWWIVQLGDLLDRRASPAVNLQTARLAQQTVDVVLAGNHEFRMLGEASGRDGAALAALATHGWPQAAAACGDWLVTHAGVHPELARSLPADAGEAAVVINDRWNRRSPGRAGDVLFDSVGARRGGPDPFGGIMWLHSDEWPAGTRAPWGQITGHVPQPQPRQLPGRRWAVDVSARGDRLAAVVRTAGSEDWQAVVVDAKRRAVIARGPFAAPAAAAA